MESKKILNRRKVFKKKINLFLVIAFCTFAIVGGLSQVFTANTAFAATSEDMVAIEDVVAEIFGDKTINSIEYLYNYDGIADYIYVNFENYGYAVFQTETFEVLEYSPVGEYYINGMLSMPGATEGLINIFEVNAAAMQYDAASFAADIAAYGVFTYEEFAELVPIPEVIFEAFNGQYLKVVIGKGLIDMEGLIALIERYADFFTDEEANMSENQNGQDNGNHNGHGNGNQNGHRGRGR